MRKNINSVANQSARSKKSFDFFQFNFTKLLSRKAVLMLVVTSLIFVGSIGIFNSAQSAGVNSNPVEETLAPQNEKDVRDAFGKLPMTFEINQGQTDEDVRFMAHGNNYNLYLTNNNAVLSLYQTPKQTNANQKSAENKTIDEKTIPSTATLQMKLADANPSPQVSGMNELEGKVNYLLGKNSEKWKTNIPTYAKVKYAGVYPDIDLVYYGNQSALEYDFIIAPHADPKTIKMTFDGAEKISIDEQSGELILHTATGEVRQHAPIVYQEVNGERKIIQGRYKIQNTKSEKQKPETQTSVLVGFEINDYDSNQPLVIDPVLAYSTYLGGSQGLYASVDPTLSPSADGGMAIAVDKNGFAYVAGAVSSPDFPLMNPMQSQCGTSNPDLQCFKAFVAKFNQAGNALVYSTYLGGERTFTSITYASGIAVDEGGNAYVTGLAGVGFPTTPNAYRRNLTGANQDAFVTKLGSTGTLIYSTYLGGTYEGANDYVYNYNEQGTAIAVDADGNAYIVGNTFSADFPTLNGFQNRCATGIRGSYDYLCDYPSGFLTKFNASGSALLYSTFIGGTSFRNQTGQVTNALTRVFGVAVDNQGNAFVTGHTNTTSFPVRRPLPNQGAIHGDRVYCNNIPAPCQDAFVMKVNTNAHGTASLNFSTFLGGAYNDLGRSIALDKAGNVYVTGITRSPDFPVTPNAYDSTYSSNQDTFVTKIKPTLNGYVYSTFLGGNTEEWATKIATDEAGNAYAIGTTLSQDFPTTPDAIQRQLGFQNNVSAYITKFSPEGLLSYSTFLRGEDFNGQTLPSFTQGAALAVDVSGNVYVTGVTTSHTFPVRNAFQPTHHGSSDNLFYKNAFVAKIVSPTPVIFIPGISGSYLYDDTAPLLPERWVGIGSDHHYLTLNPASPFYKGDHIYAPDVLRVFSIDGLAPKPFYGPLLDSLKTQGGYVEYQVGNNPARRTLQGCDFNGQHNNAPSLFVLAYDWRKDNAVTANQQLNDYIQCIQLFYGANTKVNIVTHSMGSLIARRYILEHPDKVKKLITIGAPWLGGPKSINVLGTGEFLDDIGHLVIAGTDTFKFLAEDFTGAHHLIPSRSYFALGGRPYNEIDENGNVKVYNTYDEFIARINQLYPRTRPGDNDKNFHDFPGQDDWRGDTSGVQYYHIIGLKSKADTIETVRLGTRLSCVVISDSRSDCRNVPHYQLFYTIGDGTVPRLSAERKAGGVNLNVPNARVVPFFTPSDDLVEHTGLNTNPAVIKAVLTFLNEPTPSASPNAPNLERQSVINNDAVIPMPPVQPNYYLNFDGLTSVKVADDFGNSTAPIPNDSDFLGEVPGVSYRKFDSEVIALTMPTNQNFTITFQMPNQPIALEWSKGTDKMTTDAGRYLDLMLPPNVQARLTITTQGVQDLRYDADDNGTFETLVNPTAQMSGANANDKDAPLVSFNETAQGLLSNLSISATDGESGVRKLMYSTNGTTFEPYTTTLTLDPSQTPTVYAFADDNAGNRSATVSYQTGSFKLKVSGIITDATGAGVSDVVLTLTGLQTDTTTQTVGNGFYRLAGLTAGGSYTLTPEHPFYTFTPQNVPLPVLSQSAAVNFTATRKTYTISGRVTDEDNNGVAGVTLDLSGGQTANTQTDSNGNYFFVSLAAGEDYVITASKSYFNFTDSALQVNKLGANETVDFSGTEKRFGVSGQITDPNNNGLPNVIVTISNGGQNFTTQTDGSGYYFFDDLTGGDDYTVTPSKFSVVFTPQNRSFNNLSEDKEGNFTSPTSPNTWTGEISSDWFEPTNWVGGAVPSSNANVFVPSNGVINEITIGSNDVAVTGLTIEAGRTVSIGVGRILSVTNDAAIYGNLNGEGTFICGGIATFGGMAAQTVPKSNFNNLVINNSTGVTLLGNVKVNGNLNMLDGIIETAGNTLMLETSASVTRTNGFVVGSLRKNFVGFIGNVRRNADLNDTFIFYVGTNSAGVEYSPVEANVTNVSGDSGYLVVKAFDTASPASISSPKISRYWDLDGSNITADLTFHYLDEDDDNINNPVNLRVFRNSQSVCQTDCVDETALTASVSNVSSFSPWTIAELIPTASNVVVGGRVSNSEGQGVFNARVEMIDESGTVRTAKTNSFGFYRFDDVLAGETYVFNVRHKTYQFNSQVVTILDNLQNVDFIAVPMMNQASP